MHPEVQAARDQVTQARAAFDKARDSKTRSEYDAKFAQVISALNHFNSVRARHMTLLGLDIM